MGNGTAKAREVKVTESKFADDVGMYTSTRVVLEQVAGELLGVLQMWSITGEDQAANYGVAVEA